MAGTIVEDLSEEERYLYAILSDPSGLDIAEFTWTDETQRHDLLNEKGERDQPDCEGSFCWRARPYQWGWFRCKDRQQIDQCGRSLGKSLSIQLRGFAFPFIHPDEEMVVTAPELNHLEPITDLIETRFRKVRLGQMMMMGGRSGITHRPFKMNFKNGARIMGRIPQKDGKGVKGIHPIWLELDEAQDYPHPGWIELNETLNFGKEGAVWRAHGVTKGIRDDFFEYTQENSGWKVHRFCLPGDTLVYGAAGPVPIRDVEPGMEVWTISETGDLEIDTVTARLENGLKKLWNVKAKGGYELESTGNHPYLILGREGTRRTRRDLSFEWVEAENLRPGDYLIGVKWLPGSGEKIPTTDEITASLSVKSPVRSVPNWIWGALPQMQLAFLHGYLIGDGSLSRQSKGQDPWQIGTASKRLGKELRALCHYLGLRCSAMSEASGGELGNGPQYRFYVYPDESWFTQIPGSYSQVIDGQTLRGLGENFVARRVLEVTETNKVEETFDITVGEDHNFIAEGVVVHNTAMHRPPPFWSDEEREAKIRLYHGSDSGDYRRNIFGEHGDSTSPIFNLFRLMACVDDNQESNYNQDEYIHYEIIDSWLRQAQTTIDQELDLPLYHVEKYRKKDRAWPTFWVGVDLGWTNHPTEIVVFVEETMSAEEYKQQKGNRDLGRGKSVPDTRETPRLKLLTRITLTRIAYPDQKTAFLKVIEHYRPKAFAFDATGAGQPVFQEIQDIIETDPQYDYIKTTVKGYNFSGNILVAFDDTIEVSEWATKEEYIKEAGMKRNAVDYATDQLRILIDSGRFWLPWDVDLTNEFGGQTYKVASALNQWGRREYSLGKFHALDACRMMALGWSQYSIEEFVRNDPDEPIIDLFGMG